jgi:DNA repair exonuclease SbcCD ATPase subunit
MEPKQPATAECPTCGKPLTAVGRERILEERLEALEAANARHSDAARRYGEHAERLNEQLREERRRALDRRSREPRDRRGFGSPTE